MAMYNSNQVLRWRRMGVIRLLLAVPFLIAWADGSGASEVVHLRVGSHPGFTRIVFELDTPAGYRIERASPEPGVSELVVSIDAMSIPRKLQPSKSLIGLVQILPEDGRSVARIQLKREGLSLKEMILANPPRIVLDVISPDAPKEKKKARPSPAVAKLPPKSKPPPVAPTPAPKPAPIVVAKTKAAEPAAPPPRPAATPDEPSEGGIPSMGMEAVETPTKLPGDVTAKSKPADKAAVPTPPTRPERLSAARAERWAKGKKVAKKLPSAPIEGESSFGIATIGMILAGFGVLAVGVLFVLRRRGGADEDVEEIGTDVPDTGMMPDDNPFAGLTSENESQPAFALGDEPAAPAEVDTSEIEIGGMEDDVVDPADVKEDEPVDEPVLKGASMQLEGEETVVQGVQTPPIMGTTGIGTDAGAGDEVMRMVREFERRIASLETRLDEVVDARERLERQVAAQTEELRVQRAAIARTQRAVRNLSRPDEEGPTEPALRDPN